MLRGTDGQNRETKMQNWETEFDAEGFVVLRAAIDTDLVAAAKALSDRLWTDLADGGVSAAPEGLRVLKRDLSDGSRMLDAIQGGHRAYPELRALRNGRAVADILAPRLGRELVSVVDTLFFKPPAQPGTGIAFHRDAQFRKPPEKFRDLDTKYVQVGFPLERHGAENGGLVLVPRSHKNLSIDAVQTRSVRGIDDLDATLATDGLRTVSVELEPGDVVLWHPQTIHGSPPNRSENRSRRFFVVGYMAASSCDAGDPV
jgi:ectoine hydroxylase-related dioxygenase (phytanoyl-CoA dioxygenase family)